MDKEIYLLKHGKWAEIVVNRPRQMNALSIKTVTELDRLISEVEADRDIRCLVISASGEKSFIAGADLGAMGEPGYGPENGKYNNEYGQIIYNRVENLNIPTIASINGYCLGGGLELALCCDIRIASKNASFSLPEINLGMTPGWGGTYRLPRIIGEGRAKDMIFRARRIKANTAMEYGLITEMYESVEELRTETAKLAEELASRAPIAMRIDKQLIRCSNSVSGPFMDALVGAYSFTTQDTREGIAAFLEKRTPEFKGE